MADIYQYDILGLTQNAVPDIMGMMYRNRQLGVQEGQLNRQILEAQTKEQRRQEYLADVAALEKITDPAKRPGAVAAFMRKWPEAATEAGKSLEVETGAAKERGMTAAGELVAAMDNDPPTALRMLNDRREANRAAGIQTNPLLDAAITALESGDKNAIERAKTALHVEVARNVGAKEYYTAVTGGEETAFAKDLKTLESKYGKPMADRFARTKAEGAPMIGYDAAGNPLQIRPGDLPQYGGQPQPQQGEQVTDDQGRPHTLGQDSATGLKTVTSERWGGQVAYMVHSAQEYAKVPNGAPYIAPDGELRVKGQKK